MRRLLSTVAVVVTDVNDRIVGSNGFACGLLGLEGASLAGDEISGFYPPLEWERVDALRKKNDDGGYLETTMKQKRGALIDVELSVITVNNAQGKLVESIFIIQDLSWRKAIEDEALSVSHSTKEFLAMVSHEIRTPLTAIKGSLGIMLEGATGGFNEEQRDFLATAQRNADRLEIQINNVLDYQRLDAGMYEFQFSSGDVNSLIETVKLEMDLLAQKKSLKLSLHKADALPSLMMDAQRLKRAIRNLVDNAIKFTPTGEISITSAFESGQVVVHVKDTGIGIKPEDKGKLFEHFFQVSAGHGRQTGSLGLGLVIARKIVDAHHGDIRLESKPDEGSVFSIYLPVTKG